MSKILIIDDDADICNVFERFLTSKNFDVKYAYTGLKGLEEMERFAPDLILCDFRLEDTDGKTLLIQIKEIHPDLPVIIITCYGDIKMAVEIIKQGAFDYITKPLLPEEILVTIKKAIYPYLYDDHKYSNELHLKKSIQPPLKKISNKKNKDVQYIFGDSPEFKSILNQIDLVAPTNYSVIIYGETGSGKEVIAQEIHARSKRKDFPFIAIDCGALSKELALSELFGHEKGSFTGALNQKNGSFELANGGTVFLDEISNLPYSVQVSLLRVVQERKMRRVGGNKDIELDIRIIVASNEKLWNEAKKGRFREDLYHRFNEFSITLPPLRERKNDIMTFAHFFLNQINKELDKNVLGFCNEVDQVFKSYSWPGNLRELKNVIKRSALLAEGDFINLSDLPFDLANLNNLTFEISGKGIEMDSRIDFQGNDDAINNDIPVLEEDIEKYGREMVDGKHNPIEIFSNYLKAVCDYDEYVKIIQTLKEANFNNTKMAKLLILDRRNKL